jgi:hypothetical protein
MARTESISIDKKRLNEIRRGLTKLFPKDSQTNKVLLKSLVKSAKPARLKLQSLIKTHAKKTGKLEKSIRIFPAKSPDKYGRPSVFVGPLVKVPRRIKYNKKRTMEQKAQDAANWAKEKSGFYMWFLEYGFGPKGSKKKVAGLGLLPKAAKEGGQATLAQLEREITIQINKKAKKQLGSKLI